MPVHRASKKNILVVYHSQSGTMAQLAQCFAQGAAMETGVEVTLKRAHQTQLDDLLRCHAIAIGSPEYFGTMAGMIKDFFDRTFEAAQEKTVGLPFVLLVCAGNDGRGAIAQIERIAAGYKWRKVLEHVRVVGTPTPQDCKAVAELGQTLAAGLDFGIF
ncbi:NAD(P)H-dependent oxidoreductase [Desulfobulbus sp.]|uniref:flavodoxin family protein n=1 Tax=Desulfobulbus sp. TaxID=895 RepID=UPI00286F3944|nr:NAD(P)H-dependent oxidoreductase [Desulfobulbus sp.]